MNQIPKDKKHKPIITVDYEAVDSKAGAGDAKYLSLGRATWNNEDFSAKVWRKTGQGRWSRQSEDLPIHRVLDLAILIAATVTGRQSFLAEDFPVNQDKENLLDYLHDNIEEIGLRLEELQRMLMPYTPEIQPNNSPSIFSFATSELSQDAIIAWLIRWADPKFAYSDDKLHITAQNFLRMLMGEDSTYLIESVKVGRQLNNIDIWAEVNNDAFLVIEDKIGTTIHDDQLNRYKEIAYKHCKGRIENIYLASLVSGKKS